MRFGTLLPLFALCAAGCGGSREGCYPVTGVVLYGGQPLAGGMIAFVPDADKGNSGPIAQAAIQPDGSFALSTDEKPGAVSGWHKITIAPPVNDASRPRYRDFPLRFRSPTDSNLAWEVKATGERAAKGDPNRVLIEIKP